MLNAWILWWNTQALPFTSAWWSPPIFYPMPGAFALSEHLLGVAVLTTPLQWLGVSVLGAYNISLILSFALSGYFAFLLVRHLLLNPRPGSASAPASTGSLRLATVAAAIAGVAYAFAPYRASQLSHMQVLQSQWMPLALLAMHAYIDGGRRTWLAIFASAWLLQALSNGYYLLFFPVLLGLWFACVVDWRRDARRGMHLAATWVAASLLLLPGLLEYRSVQSGLGLARSIGEMWNFSADAGAIVRRSHLLALWPNLTSRNQETFLYPGLVLLVLVAAAAFAAWRHRAPGRHDSGWPARLFIFYTASAVLMWWLAYGPAREGARASALLFPYTALTWLPGFSGLRVPARFVMPGTLCLGVAAGLAFARLAPRRPAPLALLASLVLALFAVDAWPRAIPISPPPGRIVLPEIAGAAVLELPPDVDAVSTAAMYRAIEHGRPLVNGYSGYRPPHYQILVHSLRSGDPSVLLELARTGPLLILVHASRDLDGQFLGVVQSVPGVEMRRTTNLGPVFLLPRQPALRQPPVAEALPFTWRAEGRNAAVLDLGAEQAVRLIEFPLRGNYRDLGSRVEVETSPDGIAWHSVWLDWTGGLALAGALEDPIRVPVRIPLPDVRTRYLRIHPAPDWMLPELTVNR